jgi:hypothetical protein
MADRSRLAIALAQICFARDYTKRLLADISDDDWFAQSAGVSHIAWQVGHLAVAQYGLCLYRVRGRQPGDSELIPSSFRKQFGRGTNPSADLRLQPSPADIRNVVDRVHQQSQQELAALSDADLRDPIEMPYSVEPTKLGGLFFCSAHEMLHAGQIGFIRRLLGKDPL